MLCKSCQEFKTFLVIYTWISCLNIWNGITKCCDGSKKREWGIKVLAFILCLLQRVCTSKIKNVSQNKILNNPFYLAVKSFVYFVYIVDLAYLSLDI